MIIYLRLLNYNLTLGEILAVATHFGGKNLAQSAQGRSGWSLGKVWQHHTTLTQHGNRKFSTINYRLRKHNRTSWGIDHHGRRLIFGDDGIFQNFQLERAKIVVFLTGHSIHVGFSKPRLYFFGADSLTNSQLGKNSEWVGE